MCRAEFVLAVKRLLCNPIYMVTCLGACMELAIVSGFVVYLPKYLETQFSLGKSQASVFTGTFCSAFYSAICWESGGLSHPDKLAYHCSPFGAKFTSVGSSLRLGINISPLVIQEALRYPAPALAFSWAAVCSRDCSSSPRDSSSSSCYPTLCACRCTRSSSS